ncbi:MAG: 30S ribosomal protein S8 [Candidatus Krumholzibacteria bacterium]|jgi:small subunit ribosomal protein S8|nr:30S ribosomal protein S8 [Candidatus Krumholzibacteria bacterium]MDP6797817.1 30S ribosomal protein S8 [Candidatus Krumholzibacteria bacterium]MDP7022060.1 30S ribosomal protein S8 [Candidatus Krumholzibacteria bacterium]
MSMTDPIADLLTRIRNASRARHNRVEIPASRVKGEIVRILKDQGYVNDVKLVDDMRQGLLRVYLKYDMENNSAIEGLSRVSKPGCRVYVKRDEIPKVMGGYGITVLSTSRGILTGTEAREQGVGGELLCQVW